MICTVAPGARGDLDPDQAHAEVAQHRHRRRGQCVGQARSPRSVSARRASRPTHSVSSVMDPSTIKKSGTRPGPTLKTSSHLATRSYEMLAERGYRRGAGKMQAEIERRSQSAAGRRGRFIGSAGESARTCEGVEQASCRLAIRKRPAGQCLSLNADAPAKKRGPHKRKRLKMPIKEHPPAGTILICNFDSDFKSPEMVKVRPVVVISPKISGRPGLCTIVALSTTPPNPKMPFHDQISIVPRLPYPWDAESVWVKGDMIYAIGFHRLDLIRVGKDRNGKRIYHFATLTNDQLIIVRKTCATINWAFTVDKTHVIRYLGYVGGSRSGDGDPRLRPYQGRPCTGRYQAYAWP